jgi:hypothetical protein
MRVGMGREFSDAVLPVGRRCNIIGERKELPEDVCGCRSSAGVERYYITSSTRIHHKEETLL